MKVTTKMRRYHFGTTFKIGDTGILILGALGVLGSVILFTLGMSWVFMGAYQHQAVSDKNIAWGIVMMCIGGYLVLMNAIAVTLSALALNQKNAQKTLWISIFGIFAIVPIIPAIILLFTPLKIGNESNLPIPSEFMPHEKERLQTLKMKINQGVASPREEQEFKHLLARYREAKKVA